MRFEIVVLVALVLGGAVSAVWLFERGIISGIRRRNIVVRGVTFSGDRAFRWGSALRAIGFWVADVPLVRATSEPVV